MEKFIPEAQSVAVDYDPFAGPAIQRTTPTTEAQREVWVASQVSREASCAYIESVTLCLEGALDPTSMHSAINHLVRRHESLRSTISGNGLSLVVMEQMDIPQAYTDLSALEAKEREARLASIGDQDMEQPFDLLNGPLFRTHLIRTGEKEHQLRLTGHHLVLDGWSMGIVMGDISRAYTAYASGREPQLPPAHRFSDYALAQLDFEASTDFAAVERYWLDLFKGPVPRLDLPTDRPRPKQKTYASRRLDMEMDPVLVQRVREISTRSGISLVTTLLTCFELLVYRLTGDSDLCIGLPAAGQNDFGMKELVGHCVNLLALRSTIDEEQSFISHLKERRSAMLDASDNQKYTFGTLVRKLNVPREPGRIPLCPVVFNIDTDIDSEVAFEGLGHRVISNPRKYENFELFLNATGKGNALVLEWCYNTDLFDEETIRSWMAELTALIERIGANPDARIRELTTTEGASMTLLPPAEWLGTFNDYPKVDIPTLFEQVAHHYPDHVAVELGEERITYGELLKRSTTLAHALVGMGVRPGEPVGVCTDRVVAMVVGKLAILQAGGCYVPFDPAYPADRLSFMFKDSAVKVLLTQRHLVPHLPAHDARTIFPEEITEAGPCALPRLTADAAAYIMYTSGSTGQPKGVVVPHRGIVRLVRDQFYVPFGPELSWLQISNVSFDLCTLEIWGALLNGGRCVLQPQMRPSLAEISDTIRRHQVTSVWFTTGLFNLMVDDQLDNLKGLRHIIAGGDVLSTAHVKKALAALGPHVLINGYGPTENTTFTTCYPINEATDIGKSVPIGTPLTNTTVHILDEDRKPVPIGRQGLLWTGGDGVALGYWNRPELTAERFIKDPFRSQPGALLYNTGDLARWQPDGTIEFIGRADGQVKVRGFRVELGEVENAINEVAEVKDKVVVVDQSSGRKTLICYFVPRSGDVIGNAAREFDLVRTVREVLGKQLPEYMMPTAFMPIAAIPLTGNGKVDRKALPAPVVHATSMKAGHIAPATAEEKALAEIWERVLGVSGIGIHDNFFDLGGHSLLGIQMLAAVRSAFNVELSLLMVFEAPTLAAFAQLISGSARSMRSPIVPVDKAGDILASFGQQRIWMSAQMGHDAYDMSQVLRITGDLDPKELERALNKLVERHEPLRTTFEATDDGRLLQRIHPPEERELKVELATSFDDAMAHCQQHCTQPFDLVAGPVFEARLYRIGDKEHLFLLRMHHIAGDEWSIDVMLRDLLALYQGVDLAPLQFSYADFSAWQRAQFTSDVAYRALEYWRNQLADQPALLELPTDRPRPSVFNNNGALCVRRFSRDLWQRIEVLGQQHQATPFMTLLAAFQVLLYRYAGSTDISIGTPIANREQPGTEGLVGFFINTLVLRTDLSGKPSFIDLLARVRKVNLSAFSHQDIPFERVVEALAPKRSPAYTPLFQVSFAYQAEQAFPTTPGLTFEQVDVATSTAKFDLTLFTTSGPDGLTCTLEYNTDLFDAATIERMLDHFLMLLNGIVTDPTRSIDSLPLTDLVRGKRSPVHLTIAEAPGTDQLPPAEWLGTFNDYPKVDIPTLFEEVAGQHPDNVAVELGDERITYTELLQRSTTLAHALVGMGVKPGDPVGVCTDRVLAMVVGNLAILQAGGCYVPIDPTYPEDHLSFMFRDSAVKILLTQRHLLPHLPAHDARSIFLEEITEAEPRALPRLTADAAAYIMYTSGSTGLPKGVVVPHRSIVRLVRDQSFIPFGPELTFLQMSNLSFDASTLEIWGALLNGGRCVLQPQMKPSLAEITDTISRHGVTTVWFTAGLFNLLVDERLEQLKGLKHIMTGGDVLSVAHVKRALAVLGPHVLINGYGPTENTTFTTCHPLNEISDIGQSIPIGLPLNNTTVHILDEELKPVPIGRQGLLWTGGDGVALGYLNRPELTAERFIKDPFRNQPGALLYNTGDLARWRPDGTIEFIGRADGQVKVRGFRIEPGEIENAINRMAEVKDNVVVVRNNGSGEKQLVAYVVPRERHGANGVASVNGHLSEVVREHLQDAIPAYMIPTAFVVLDELPLNANGKVDKHALPDHAGQTVTARHVAPRNAIEARLAKLWGGLLNTPDPGVHDNFFDLGGQSMIGIRLLARVEDEFGVRLALNALFLAPTIAQFADLLHEAPPAKTELQNLVMMQPLGERPPLFCVHGDEASHYLPKYLGNDQPFYAYFHQGEDGSPIRYTTVEEIAAHFIAELKQVRPEGPYLLCGYSFGGIVAYEMARLLTAEGFDVPMLAMFDTYAPKSYVELMQKEQRLHEPLKQKIMRHLVKRQQARGRITSLKLRHFHIIDTYDKAIRDYRPMVYDGPVTMYKAERSPGPDDMGWAELAPQLNIHLLPGDHYSLIKEPDVALLAKGLMADIDLVASRAIVEAV